MKVPLSSSHPWITVSAAWPEGEVEMHDAIFADGKPPSEQFADTVGNALGFESQKQTKAAFAQALKELPLNPLAAHQAARQSLPKRTAKVVDEHFQYPARLVSGGDASEIELFIELPEGYLKFRYYPKRVFNQSKVAAAMSGEEREAWLIGRARELTGIYTWIGFENGGGFKTAYGTLNHEADMGFRLYFYGSVSDKSKDMSLTLRSISWYNPEFAAIFTSNYKQWQLKSALKEAIKGRFERTRFQPVTVAGAQGMEKTTLWYEPGQAGNKTSLHLKWNRRPYEIPGLDELEMSPWNLTRDRDMADQLGLWEAVSSSIHHLEMPPKAAAD